MEGVDLQLEEFHAAIAMHLILQCFDLVIGSLQREWSLAHREVKTTKISSREEMRNRIRFKIF